MTTFSVQRLRTGWEFKRTNDTKPDAWLPVAKVPSVVHIDLIAHDKIPDPSHDTNELDVQWVGEERWSYRCTFRSPRGDNDRTSLVFEGLDTFATVRLNGTVILESDNMFLEHRVDVTAAIKRPDGEPLQDTNTLQIDFDSAPARGRALMEAHPEHRFVGTLGGNERMAVRKAQYHWGWDWGPTLLTAGPWRPVRLETFQSRIDDVSIRYSLDESLKCCQGTVSARIDGGAGSHVRITLCSPQERLVFENRSEVGPGGLAVARFELSDPCLWNPHGYGDQHQYLVQVELLDHGISAHVVTKKIGFRKAEVINEADDFGKSLYFRINGVDVFAGGSCWIPGDMFPPRVSADDYREWLTLMVRGNQIMTRVWGGGYYEDASFYDICDELGILVWQDFMFACGSYPAYPTFLESVELEARENVRRLNHHASIVIYAGGNENHYIQEHFDLSYDWADKDPQSWLKTSFPSRYIYQYLLPKVVEEEAPSVSYRPDSPWNDGLPIISFDRTTGDLHQWNVWHIAMRLYQDYHQIGGRFNSEFGIQSFPHLSTINQFVTDISERHPQSATLDFHNRCRDHEQRLATYIRNNFKATDSNLKNWVYLSHLLQSEAMHYAYRGWRRDWGSKNARRCGGALVWQLNDLWPATSWAIVDSSRLRKAAFYGLKRDLEPVAAGVVRTHHDWTKAGAHPPAASAFDAWIACDGSLAAARLLEAGRGALDLELRFISIRTGLDALPPRRHRLAGVRPNGTTVVCEAAPLANPPTRDAYVILAKVLLGEAVVARDVDWPQPFKHFSFAESRGLRVRLAESRARIEITAARPTKGLLFTERRGLSFSDNGFDVMPGEEYVVEVEGLRKDEELEWAYLGMDECPEGLTNGLTKGLSKGLTGLTNGLTNGLNGLIKRLTNGLTNGHA
ncbi:glycoside hydrolase [Coniochaeta ligniaria NRRL 30616]|uniref:Beta-mannosidase B n=1 Tax=Coniochaeta ligniaria NRRL 30616 TaxID=1408157 RepID=A0A1J7ISE1_9PEZI|nr:glycoside hydrolase [Coniochaeta ligniaria NRRL 30616]